jgi:HEPN domain-containing protein
MTNVSLAASYLTKARVRLKILPVLLAEAAYSDVVREAQETVELACKAILRQLGIEPPHWHDVGELLREYRARLPSVVDAELERVVTASAWLRKEREFSFYGDIDFIPTERYGRDEATRAVEDARFVVGIAERVIPRVDPHAPTGRDTTTI